MRTTRIRAETNRKFVGHHLPPDIAEIVLTYSREWEGVQLRRQTVAHNLIELVTETDFLLRCNSGWELYNPKTGSMKVLKLQCSRIYFIEGWEDGKLLCWECDLRHLLLHNLADDTCTSMSVPAELNHLFGGCFESIVVRNGDERILLVMERLPDSTQLWATDL